MPKNVTLPIRAAGTGMAGSNSFSIIAAMIDAADPAEMSLLQSWAKAKARILFKIEQCSVWRANNPPDWKTKKTILLSMVEDKERDIKAEIYQRAMKTAQENKIANSKSPFFSKLPAEIRNMIMSLAMFGETYLTEYNLQKALPYAESKGSDLGTSASEKDNLRLPLAHVCSQMREESFKQFVHEGELYIFMNYLYEKKDPVVLARMLDTIGKEKVEKMRRIRFHVRGMTRHGDAGHGIGVQISEQADKHRIVTLTTFMPFGDRSTIVALQRCRSGFGAYGRGECSLYDAIIHFVKSAPTIFFPRPPPWDDDDDDDY